MTPAEYMAIAVRIEELERQLAEVRARMDRLLEQMPWLPKTQ